MSEADFQHVLCQQAGTSLAAVFQTWVHGTDDTDALPCAQLLQQHGVELVYRKAELGERLGVTVEAAGGSGAGQLRLKTVLHGSVAQQAGLAPHDELLAVNGWRMQTLNCLLPHLQGDANTDNSSHAKATDAAGVVDGVSGVDADVLPSLTLLYVRDGRLHTTTLSLPAAEIDANVGANAEAKTNTSGQRLKALQQRDTTMVAQWLDGSAMGASA